MKLYHFYSGVDFFTVDRVRLHFRAGSLCDIKLRYKFPEAEQGEKMLDWAKYRQELSSRIGELGQLTPATLEGARTLGGAGDKTGHLEPKTRELIALAVAVTTRCDGCIAVHSADAVKFGATREEVAEALGVAIALNAGAALVYSSRVLDAMDSVTK